MRSARLMFVLLAVCPVACGGGAGSGGAAGMDGGARDAGTWDAGAVPHADAGANDAGAADARAGDAGAIDAAATSATCPGLVCNDFESGTAGAGWYAKATGLTIETGKAAHGKYAAHIHIKPYGPGAMLHYIAKFDYHGPLYARFYMYLSPDHDFGHTRMFRVGGGNDGVTGPNVEAGGYWGVWLIAPDSNLTWGKSNFPTKTWLCVQAEITEHPVTLRWIVEGKLELSASSNHFDTMPSYEPLLVGLASYHPDTMTKDVDYWVDDVEFDSKPVPCLGDVNP